MNSMNSINRKVTSSVDFDAPGKQHGHLSLPHSNNLSAWGTLRLPVCVVANGDGPTVTLIAGSHGDEYEGPITLFNLADTLEVQQINGRVIILPALNAPALAAATRLSPIDQCNMNRSFPGNPDGSITEQIADFVNAEIIDRSDIVLDLHAGGKTLDFTPLAAVHFLEDKQQQQRAEEIMIAFGAPNSLRMRELDNRGMLDTVVEDQGKLFITTELGGGGTATRESIEIATVGCRNVLAYSGILDEEITLRSTRMLEMPEENCFVVSDSNGLLEMCVTLGQSVYRGSPIARVIDMENTGKPPVEIKASRDGILMARHFPGLIHSGDCLAVIAEEVPR